MNALIDAAFARSRAVLMIFIFILALGTGAYLNIPKESEPDIAIPTIYVSMNHEGISPEDADRLIIKPMEKELKSLEGLREIKSSAIEGHASITLEFEAGFDADTALADVRDKVDRAKGELPNETEEPRVTEVNVALFPILTIGLFGSLPERQLVAIGQRLKDRIEALEGVLEVEITGKRDEVLEVIVDPVSLETYGINFSDLSTLLQRNNRLVAAGAMDTSSGRMVLKVPGTINNISSLMDMPVKVAEDAVVTFKDIVKVRRTFEDPDGFARFNGQPGIALEVKKRVGANIIETVEEIRAIVSGAQPAWPSGLQISFMEDKSNQIETLLSDLENNILAAVVLVLIVVISALGIWPGLLVGLAIPGSFLAGIMVISNMGMTLNIVVLFSLILVVGLLVDGVIVTVELADRKLAEGYDRKAAYASASKRMAWPIIASTATTLAVFVPLLAWPGMMGQFMKYLPITVMVTLAASLAMALIFIPTLGSIIGQRPNEEQSGLVTVRAAESGDLKTITGATGAYLSLLEWLLRRPATVLGGTIGLLAVIGVSFSIFGKGVEFFPDVEPDFIQVQVRARGDLSIHERDRLIRHVEQRLVGLKDIKVVYAKTLGIGSRPEGIAEDAVGLVRLEFIDWRRRRKVNDIIADVRGRMSDLAGVVIEVRKQDQGPVPGKPVKLEVDAADWAQKIAAINQIRDVMHNTGGFVDIEDSRPLPGIEWRVLVDREKAARFGADVVILGEVVKLLTAGIKLGEYRPDDAADELDIRLRFPSEQRNLRKLLDLRVMTSRGLIPIQNFVELVPAPKVTTIARVDGKRIISIEADVASGLLVDDQVRALQNALRRIKFDPMVQIKFKGEDKEQRETGAFLSYAFMLAIALMALVLVTQFNSFYQTILVFSAIIFSTAGVLIGLLITNQPFGIVMCGIGIIALAGIVVNNNIILIDTFNNLKAEGCSPHEAILRTAAQRVRPVLLTSATTILGLMPMVLTMSVDIIGRDIAFGAPSTQWWTQLSSSIAGGLAFATLLTLVLMPCMLILGENLQGPQLAWVWQRLELIKNKAVMYKKSVSK